MTKKTSLAALRSKFYNGTLAKPDFISQALDIHRILFDYVDITKDTDIHEINISPEGIRFVMGDDRLTVYAPPNEARVAPIEVMNFNSYEPQETLIMDLLSIKAHQILDIGANIGWFSLRFAKRLPYARIHAFEPLPEAHDYLQRNVAVNGLGSRITCYNYGLSNEAGSFEFYITPTGGTNASLLNVAGAHNARKVYCLTMTLSQWCTNNQISPNFIKCDVEGAELLVFRGGREILNRDKPIVFSELLRKWAKPFNYHPNDMLEFFAELGYRYYAVGTNGIRRITEVTDETIETNFVFVHPSTHSQEIDLLESMT